MKKLIIGFLTGVLVTIPIMLMIQEPKALEPEIVYVTPPPQPTPTPQIIYKERLTDLEQVVANTKDSCVMIYAYRSDGSGEPGTAYGNISNLGNVVASVSTTQWSLRSAETTCEINQELFLFAVSF